MATTSQYLYRIRPARRTMLSEGPTAYEASVVAEHFNYLQRLVEDNVVLLAGRTINDDESAFGIVIFIAPSEVAALEIMRSDPAVAKGVMDAELFPYRIALWSSRGPGDTAEGT